MRFGIPEGSSRNSRKFRHFRGRGQGRQRMCELIIRHVRHPHSVSRSAPRMMQRFCSVSATPWFHTTRSEGSNSSSNTEAWPMEHRKRLETFDSQLQESFRGAKFRLDSATHRTVFAEHVDAGLRYPTSRGVEVFDDGCRANPWRIIQSTKQRDSTTDHRRNADSLQRGEFPHRRASATIRYSSPPRTPRTRGSPR